jgi:cytochrome c-type biogenesis protein CcmH/NrfF
MNRGREGKSEVTIIQYVVSRFELIVNKKTADSSERSEAKRV